MNARPARRTSREGAATGKTTPSAPGKIRIIGGRWKRTPIAVVGAAELRPSPDRVRETLFNWLGGSVQGSRCLDLFAGTGALGLEAASRGAAEVVLVERDRAASAAISAIIDRLGAHSEVKLINDDALTALGRLAATGTAAFDVVFLDPPFGQAWPERVWSALEPLMSPAARLYVEAGSAFAAPPGWAMLRSGQAGKVHYHLLVRGAVATDKA